MIWLDTNPFLGRKGGEFGSRSLEESQSVTRAIGRDGRCQQPAMEISQALKNKGAEVTLVWWKHWSFSDLEHLDPCPEHRRANNNSSKL